MFSFGRANKFRQLSSDSSGQEDQTLQMKPQEDSFITRHVDSSTSTETGEEALVTTDEDIAGDKKFPALTNLKANRQKPSLARFAASANKFIEKSEPEISPTTTTTTNTTTKFEASFRKSPTSTPMKDAATNVKNANGAVAYLQKASLKSSLKNKLRQIARDRLTIKQIFRQYVDQSTLHGFRYTCSGDSYYVRRFLWACLMIMGAVYFIVKLKGGIIEYFSYPFSTLSTLEYVSDSMPFPAITFCSVNQFKLDRLRNSPLHRLYMEDRLPLLKNWTDPGFDIPGTELHDELVKVSLNIDDIFKECDWIRRDSDHPMIPHRNCSSRNFTTHFSETGQICFTLNSGKENHNKLEVENFGLKFGYEALFDFNNNDNVIPYSEYTGLHVIIHDQKEQPTGKVGFVISPGFKFFVNLQREEVNNLEPPYGTNCGERDLKYFKTYSQSACMMEKETDYVGEKCACRDIYMPDNGLPYCSLKKMFSCAYPAKDSFDKHTARFDCPVDCNVVEYLTEITESRFIHDPPKGLEPAIIKRKLQNKQLTYSHILDLYGRMSSEELDEYIEDNVVEILFFFGDTSKIIHTQEASFDFYQFLGDMGGEIGLMLGASLLTFFEFVDLFAFLSYHQLLRLQKRWMKDDQQDLTVAI